MYSDDKLFDEYGTYTRVKSLSFDESVTNKPVNTSNTDIFVGYWKSECSNSEIAYYKIVKKNGNFLINFKGKEYSSASCTGKYELDDPQDTAKVTSDEVNKSFDIVNDNQMIFNGEDAKVKYTRISQSEYDNVK